MSGVFHEALRWLFDEGTEVSDTFSCGTLKGFCLVLWRHQQQSGLAPIWLIIAGGSLTPGGEQGLGALLCGLLRTLLKGYAAGLKAAWVIMILKWAFMWTSNVT